MANCSVCGGNTIFVVNGIVRCEYCGKLYSSANGELSAADPERLYYSALNMAKSNNESSLKSAIETLEALGSYKDSSALANTYRGMIAQSRAEAEERRLEAERQAELEKIAKQKKAFERQQQWKKYYKIIIAAGAVTFVICLVVISMHYRKKTAYKEAVEMYNAGQYKEALDLFENIEGYLDSKDYVAAIKKINEQNAYNNAVDLFSAAKYEEALQAFEKLDDYSDSESYVSEINIILREREKSYEKGVAYYEKAAYAECIDTLETICTYLDSDDYIEKSVEALYQQASEEFVLGKPEKAKELLEKIPENSSKYMDAELMLADIEALIIEQANAASYEQAKTFYDNGDYETAQRIFINLGNFSDSATYRISIGNIYYEKACELFDQGEYVQCGEVLSYIDTEEEWSEYTLAKELFNLARNEYQSIISANAKAISREQDDSKMYAYIDENVCCLLTKDEGNTLKKECHVNKVMLNTLKPYATGEQGGIIDASDVEHRTDTLGNVYSNAFYSIRQKRSSTYFINNQYNSFTATVAVMDNFGLRPSYHGEIKIYGDDALLWHDDAVDSSTKPYTIELDIAAISDLKIETYSVEYGWEGGLYVLLADATLCE